MMLFFSKKTAIKNSSRHYFIQHCFIDNDKKLRTK